MIRKKDPKVGTGKKPKGSGRRLYTDENPKDTVPIAFATQQDARDTVRRVKNIDKPFARTRQATTPSLPCVRIFLTRLRLGVRAVLRANGVGVKLRC